MEKDLPPREHFVDAAYISAELLVHSRDEHGITLRGPTRPSQGWQMQVAGAYTIEQFTVDWEQQQVCCPQGKWAASWQERVDAGWPSLYHRRLPPAGLPGLSRTPVMYPGPAAGPPAAAAAPRRSTRPSRRPGLVCQ